MLLFYFLISLGFLISEDFILENTKISFEIDGLQLERPFSGGLNRPRIQWVDWNDDGETDLFILDQDGYIRYYENSGESDLSFNLKTTSFFNIFANGWFFLNDFDNDSDLDLATQSVNPNNEVKLYINSSGTFEYMGKLMLDDESNLYSDPVMVPTFADIDDDGDKDFFSCNVIGTINYFENIGLQDGIPVFRLISSFWEDIYIVGGSRGEDRHGAAAINFVDIDSDGDLDLSWGDYFQQSLYIVWNVGTSSEPSMNSSSVIQEYPPSNPVQTAGQNMPSFSDLDKDGDLDLFISVLSGAYGNDYKDNFMYFENIDTNLGTYASPNYVLSTSNFLGGLDFVSDSFPSLVDIDSDGDLDLFVSNRYDDSQFPYRSRIAFFRNTGSAINPYYVLENSEFLGADLGLSITTEFLDIDSDGDYDIILGDFNGYLALYENIGDQETFEYHFKENIADIDLSGNSVVSAADIDLDGDLDLFTGELNGSVKLFENTGSSMSYQFSDQGLIVEIDSLVSYSSPELYDIDLDGDLDIILGSSSSNLLLVANEGTSQSHFFESTEAITSYKIGSNLKPSLGRVSSGSIDMIVGVETGGLYHLSMKLCDPGDVTIDMTINILDVVSIVQYVLGNIYYSNSQICSADINNDSTINILDVISVVQIIMDS